MGCKGEVKQLTGDAVLKLSSDIERARERIREIKRQLEQPKAVNEVFVLIGNGDYGRGVSLPIKLSRSTIARALRELLATEVAAQRKRLAEFKALAALEERSL